MFWAPFVLKEPAWQDLLAQYIGRLNGFSSGVLAPAMQQAIE